MVIDFSSPAASTALAQACAARGGPALVIGSTGFEDAQIAALAEPATKVAIVRAGNFSLGVNMLLGLVEQAARALGPQDYDIEVQEAHHRRKVDAPSGTALMLGEAAAQGRDVALASVARRGRDGITGARPTGAIGFSVIRGGGIVGEHSVVFAAEDEILTLSHSARDRSLFARGALAAARWVAGKPPGAYDHARRAGLSPRGLTTMPSLAVDELLTRDATDQLAALSHKRISAVELLKAELARHEQTHGQLNAVVAVALERSLEHAAAIDELRARGEPLGLLAGLPMTVKDTFDAVGLPASSGLAELRRRQAEDATAVRHARHAGAVIWGKTNTPVMAGDWQTFNDLYGATNNPWDVTRTPGGSSGGSAAALAAGVTALEIGSDIGGSLRVPASFCGVFSHKPTWGLVSQHGHVPPSPGSWSERDLNVIGPMARSARDLRLLLSVLENGLMAPRAPPAELKGARIGLWINEPGFDLDPQVREVIETFAADLAAAGAEVTPISAPVHMPTLVEAYRTLLGAVLGEDMPPKTARRLQRTRRAFWRSKADRDSALSFTASHRDWMAADAVRQRQRHEIQGVFERFDAILGYTHHRGHRLSARPAAALRRAPACHVGRPDDLLWRAP